MAGMGEKDVRGARFRILHVITNLATGGAEQALLNLLKGGMADQFDCHIISLMGEGTIGPKIRDLNIPVTAMGISRGIPTFAVLGKLRRAIKRIEPDLIQGWMYHGNIAAWLSCRFSSNTPLLAWNVRHSIYDLTDEKIMTRQVIRLNRFLSEAPDILLYNSRLARGQHEKFGFSSLNSRVIPNGIDVHSNTFSDEARTRIRTELSIPKDAPVVGHVARLHPMKDHPLFFRAVIELTDKFPTTHFILSGRDVSFDNKDIKQIVPSRVRNRFHLLGERSDIAELMSAMDVLVSSSYGEGFPNVIGEAMAVGVPCVATDVGDCALIIGETGIIVPARDNKSLAVGIGKLLRMSVGARQQLGIYARNRIVQNYALESIVTQYNQLYNDMISKGRH